MARADVVVVGAGIGGTATALLMARAGASVTLLERTPAPGVEGAGILLQPNGLAVLTGLDLDEQLRKRGCVLRRVALYGSGSRPIADSAVPDYGRGLDYLLALRRSDLQEILFDAVAQESAIVRRFGADVTRCSASAAVELHWQGRTSTIQANLVVGADGVHSTVRSSGNFGATVHPTGRSYLRGLVPRLEVRSGEFWTRLGLFGASPVDSDTIYFYAAADAPAVAHAFDSGDVQALAKVWEAALPLAGRIMGQVRSHSDLLHNEVIRVDCKRWHDGWVALVGDAAHAMAPTAGQGANSALVDGTVLTAELACNGSQSIALERYTSRRRSAARAVQDRADDLTRLSGLRRPAARLARDVGIRVVLASPGAAARSGRLLQQEDPAALFDSVSALRP